ncbi:uncharacterized protein MYCGRDRAFT_97180 [Zymoseptoria tritici IPO323]|uniref:RNI-like protein n=1 Tax=Zymoseptoria tritici (strain CBS 115943 / IPO323) TaxID=336722 RepID=F9XP50_ZYMTI|nr:uncharacterized protein MYCGRDRAFT_97180 [Zymoseptoria tritici IPO323]EGP83056.1 hypothetical protein MYCGRDRAFT_97180 [Zymoseptoria tritici IPO323]
MANKAVLHFDSELYGTLFAGAGTITSIDESKMDPSAILLEHPAPPAQDDNATKHLKWVDRISKQGPWDESIDPPNLSGPPALPMPVEVSDAESLGDFFSHLRNNGTHQAVDNAVVDVEPHHDTELLEFEKGVIYADGRIDLCKNVTGPAHIGSLMSSLRTNEFAKHFLLGNNIIGPTGAKEIATFIHDFPNRFETWYLAGNCIDAASFSLLVDAMITSPIITNVWLKRNPLTSTAARDIARLIIHSPNLRTLDLDQTNLSDAGVASLFNCLTARNQPIALRQIYLNANGIHRRACTAIATYLVTANCHLHSLYLSNNPIGSAASLLAPGLARTRDLYRLVMQSCGLTSTSLSPLLTAIIARRELMVIDFGQSYATEDLGARYNWFTDESTPALIDLVKRARLLHFKIGLQPMSQTAVNELTTAVIEESKTLLVFHAQPLLKGKRTYAEVKAGQLSARLRPLLTTTLETNIIDQYARYCKKSDVARNLAEFETKWKRFLLSPEDVRFIDSVYRNRDAGLARRGLMVLKKKWDEGEGVPEGGDRRVAEGEVGGED